MSVSSPTIAPSISLPAERFFRGALFFLLFTSAATLISTGKLDLFTSVLVPVALFCKGVRWWLGKPPELSHRAATWMVAAYLGFFPLDVFILSRAFVANSTNPGLYAALLSAVHFLLFAMLVRLFSARTDRDALFLAMLSFAAILATAVLTIDTSFLVLFFIFILFGVATFLSMEMRRGAIGAVGWQSSHFAGEEGHLARALSLASLSVAVGAILLGGALFFFFPRFSAGYLGRASMQPSLMTGFTDDVELGQIGEIKKDSTVVMRVKTGKPVGYPMLRWRGIALSTFDGKRWSSPHRVAAALSPNSEGWIDVSDPDQKHDASGNPLLYTVLLQPMASDALFAPGNVKRIQGNLSGEGAHSFWNSRHTYVWLDATGSMFNPFHNYAPVRYDGYSRLPALNPPALRKAGTEYSDIIRKNYLQLPDLDARIPQLAKAISERAESPYDKAMAIETFLRSRFAYTLNLAGKPGDDPLAHFLFETHAGHCEYFASAMAIMLRTQGIPSREVNGFLPGEYNDLAGDYIVRASDAHSWVEVYFPGTGWVTFDPTPASAQESGWMSRLGLYLDWMELSWGEWVINYDFAHQVQMAQGMQRNSRSWTEAVRSRFAHLQRQGKRWIKSWLGGHDALRLLLPIGAILLLVVLRYGLLGVAFRWLRLRWEMRATRPTQSNPQLASRLYGELLRLLERRGFTRASSQTPTEFVDAFEVSSVTGVAAASTSFAGATQMAPAVREFTQLYVQARFGGAPCDAPRLHRLLEQIRAALRAR